MAEKGALESLDCSLRLEAIREDVALLEEQGIRLEDKHRMNRNVLEKLRAAKPGGKGDWFCLGKESFMRINRRETVKQIENYSLQLWEEIEQVQSALTAKKDLLDQVEEAANP
mmetsp:Transcript_1852/g.5595  ORF Transcript_1852/g.5595 Transcript_1852/m.5595 type:complete len:113 (-) Transcript_1852:141-479(-)